VFSKITEECGEIRIYACSRDLKTIKSFTHGRVLFKTHADTVVGWSRYVSLLFQSM
jgi:hypothetical protein